MQNVDYIHLHTNTLQDYNGLEFLHKSSSSVFVVEDNKSVEVGIAHTALAVHSFEADTVVGIVEEDIETGIVEPEDTVAEAGIEPEDTTEEAGIAPEDTTAEDIVVAAAKYIEEDDCIEERLDIE